VDKGKCVAVTKGTLAAVHATYTQIAPEMC